MSSIDWYCVGNLVSPIKTAHKMSLIVSFCGCFDSLWVHLFFLLQAVSPPLRADTKTLLTVSLVFQRPLSALERNVTAPPKAFVQHPPRLFTKLYFGSSPAASKTSSKLEYLCSITSCSLDQYRSYHPGQTDQVRTRVHGNTVTR